MRCVMLALMVMCCCCCCVGEAGAQVPIGLEQAGVAYYAPVTSSGESMTTYVLNFKVLDIEDPEEIQNFWDVCAYVGSRLSFDALIYDKDTGRLPVTIEEADFAPALSLPLLSTEGAKTGFRAGLTYSERTKLGAGLQWGYSF